MLQRIGRVDLGFELDRLDGRAFQTEWLSALGRTIAARALHLVAARQRVRVVLQRDGALHGAAAGIEDDEGAFDEFEAAGERTHGTFPTSARSMAGALAMSENSICFSSNRRSSACAS